MWSPRPFPPILLDGLQVESLSREHSLVARGVARWWEELEFSMAAPQEEANPREKRVNGGEPVSCRGTKQVGGRLWRNLGSQGDEEALGRPRVTG